MISQDVGGILAIVSMFSLTYVPIQSSRWILLNILWSMAPEARKKPSQLDDINFYFFFSAGGTELLIGRRSINKKKKTTMTTNKKLWEDLWSTMKPSMRCKSRENHPAGLKLNSQRCPVVHIKWNNHSNGEKKTTTINMFQDTPRPQTNRF